MSYEIVLTALTGGIFSLFGIYLLYTLQTRKMKLEHNYKIRRFKLGNKYKLRSKEMPEDIGKESIISKIIKRGVERYAPDLLGGESEEYDEGDYIDGLIDRYAPVFFDKFITKDKNEEKDKNYVG